MAWRTVHPQIIKADSTILNPTNIKWHVALENNANDFRQINNGTATNVTYGSSYGKVNDGAYFNGAGYILYNPADEFNLTDKDFTISFWFKTTTSAYCSLIAQTSSSGSISTTSFAILMNAGKIIPYLCVAGATRTLTSANSFNDGNWHFCAFTRRDNLYELLIDNNLEATSATNQSIWNSISWNSVNFKLALGKFGELASGLFYTGSLDEVGILNIGADRNLLTYLYNGGAGKTPPY
jgi:hypothetical protein